jgi:hypothetical protein
MKKSNTFKKCAIATIVAGSFMAPVHAQNTITPGFDGFVSGAVDLNRTKGDAEIGFGPFEIYDDGKSSDPKGELRASVAYTSSMGIGLQLDQVYSSGKYDFEGVGTKVNTTDTAAHLFYRGSNFLFGGFAQQRSYDFSYKTGEPYLDVSLDAITNGLIKNRTFMGLEGQVFLGDIQIDGQVGRQNQDIGVSNFLFFPLAISGDKLKGNFGSINANYFANDNWKVGASFGFSDLKGDLDAIDFLLSDSSNTASLKNKTQTYGLNSEYRFPNTPLSVFARYQHTRNKLTVSYEGEGSGSAKSSENDFGLGIKVTFGSGSLRSQAAGGASLNPVRVNDNLPLGVTPSVPYFTEPS